MKNIDKTIEGINNALQKNKLTQKQLYEHLIAKGVIKPDSEKEFKQIIEYGISVEAIDKSRFRSWNKKRGKIPRFFTKQQLVKIFDSINRPKDSIACFMALICGLRISEICNLKVENIDFENHQVFIEDSKNPNRKRDNYGTDKIVQFDPAIDGIIKKWLDIIGNSSKWFLPSDKSPDKPLTKKSLHERFRGYLKQTGLLIIELTYKRKQKIRGKWKETTVNRHKYYFHCFRHTMACIIYDKTGDIYAVNRFLGHKQLDTTMIYAKMTDTKMRKTISTVFGSLHYNFQNGIHMPNPEPMRHNITKTQPIVQASASSPLQLLELQFVKGEISDQEFLRKKQVLSATELKKTIEIT